MEWFHLNDYDCGNVKKQVIDRYIEITCPDCAIWVLSGKENDTVHMFYKNQDLTDLYEKMQKAASVREFSLDFEDMLK